MENQQQTAKSRTSAREAASVTLAASLAAMGNPCWETNSENRGCNSQFTTAVAEAADEMAELGSDLQISRR
jgi:hypothetical protein